MPVDDRYTFPPQHPGAWTVAEVLALPEDRGQRVELLDGALILSPAPTYQHQRVMQQVQVALIGAVPGDMEVMPGINVLLNAERLVIPDLAVTATPMRQALYGAAADMVMVVEIISPSSRVLDKAHKRVLYAEARIPFYLLVDPASRPVHAVLFGLEGADYVQMAISEQGRIRFAEPFPVDVELG